MMIEKRILNDYGATKSFTVSNDICSLVEQLKTTTNFQSDGRLFSSLPIECNTLSYFIPI